MNENNLITKNVLELKYKLIIQRIDRLYNVFQVLNLSKETTKLSIVKNQYLKMYTVIIEKEEYDKYYEVEDIIVNEISKLELCLERKMYYQSKEIIFAIIEDIKKSKNYQDFNNLDNILETIIDLKKIAKEYSAYINQNEFIEIYNEIIKLKFDILYRKQVEQLIWKKGPDISNFMQYEDEEEKKFFINLLKEKIQELSILDVQSIEDNKILNILPDEILGDAKLLERLIIIDMKRNSYSYINLIKAKIFNAHRNIASKYSMGYSYMYDELRNPQNFSEYEIYEKINNDVKKKLMENKVGYSLLISILDDIITNENINIIECIKIYETFGFKCETLIHNIGQYCVKMIFDNVCKSKEYDKFLIEEKNNIEKKEGYCKIYFEALEYSVNSNKNILEPLWVKYKYLYKKLGIDVVKDNLIARDSLLFDRLSKKRNHWVYTDGKHILYKEIKTRYGVDEAKAFIGYENILEEISETKGLIPPLKGGITYKEFELIYEKHYKTLSQSSMASINLSRCFFIYVNLDDISDLPIDYEKLEIVSKKEIEEISKREIEEMIKESSGCQFNLKVAPWKLEDGEFNIEKFVEEEGEGLYYE